MRYFINLRISGTELDFQEITTKLEMPPVNCGKKGDVIESRVPGIGKNTIQEDFWIGEHKPDENANFEENLEHFVVKLIPSSNYLKSLAEKHNVTIGVSAYPDNEQANLHVSLPTIMALSEIGATLDCSMAFLKDFYDGNY